MKTHPGSQGLSSETKSSRSDGHPKPFQPACSPFPNLPQPCLSTTQSPSPAPDSPSAWTSWTSSALEHHPKAGYMQPSPGVSTCLSNRVVDVSRGFRPLATAIVQCPRPTQPRPRSPPLKGRSSSVSRSSLSPHPVDGLHQPGASSAVTDPGMGSQVPFSASL